MYYWSASLFPFLSFGVGLSVSFCNCYSNRAYPWALRATWCAPTESSKCLGMYDLTPGGALTNDGCRSENSHTLKSPVKSDCSSCLQGFAWDGSLLVFSSFTRPLSGTTSLINHMHMSPSPPGSASKELTPETQAVVNWLKIGGMHILYCSEK